MTETAPDTGTTSQAPAATDYGPLASVVATGDHTRIGRMFLGGSFIGLVATLVIGLLLDVERTSPESVNVLDSDVLMQMFSAHRLGLVLLFALPAFLGLALVVVPLQVGASTVAFARAAALAFWTWLLGTALWIAGYLIGGGPGGSDLRGTDLWLLANIMIIAGLLVATVCVITTVLGLRTQGMTLARVPLFSFSMLVAGSVWLLTLPVAVANLVLIYLDHRYGQVLFGANEQIVPQLSWLFGQPQIYAFAIPVLGIAGDTIPVFSRARQRFYLVSFAAIGIFGALSIGAWAQLGLPERTLEAGDELGLANDPLYVGMAVVAILPVLMVLALGADTMRAGRLRLGAPVMGALLSGLVLLLATVAGALYAIEPLEVFGTSWALGHFSLTMGAVVVSVLAGLWYWAPKVLGRLLGEGPGRLLPLVAAAGSVLAGIAFVAAGALDQPDSPAPGAVKDGVELLNILGAVGTALVLLGVVGAIAATLTGRGSVPDTPDDPWGGHTLEWSTASPPVRGNFAEPPEVTNEAPLFTPTTEEEVSV